jgi:ABC-type branched-subunit amino acid transport system ATPase component
MSAEPIIEVDGLTRHYGERIAVDHIDFAISPGEVSRFLGPNEAGKSTTARMLTGWYELAQCRAVHREQADGPLSPIRADHASLNSARTGRFN